jgi:hypothetical protein
MVSILLFSHERDLHPQTSHWPNMDLSSDQIFSLVNVTVESLADHAGLNGGDEDRTDESRSRQLKRMVSVAASSVLLPARLIYLF